MAQYSVVCDQGREPETFAVEANSDEEAVQMLLDKARAHNPKSILDKALLTSKWSK